MDAIVYESSNDVQYHPFVRLKNKFPQMNRDAAFVIRKSMTMSFPASTVVNDRAGGNAPEITRRALDNWSCRPPERPPCS